jgi:hypothetical protein
MPLHSEISHARRRRHFSDISFASGVFAAISSNIQADISFFFQRRHYFSPLFSFTRFSPHRLFHAMPTG